MSVLVVVRLSHYLERSLIQKIHNTNQARQIEELLEDAAKAISGDQ